MAHKSYYLYQRYIKIGDQDWVPTYPMEFSVSGDSEDPMPMVMKMDEDPACGGSSTVPQYRWVDMDISTDYICDDCPAPPFQGKWLATYTGGTTSSATCDSTSAITENEVTLADLESVLIGDCVTTIGNKAFYDCSGLTSATIGSGVVNIDSYAFSYCRVLTGITIPNSVTNIGRFAFGACNGLSNLTIGSNVTSIDQSAFQYCNSLTSLTIPDSVTSIGPATFQGCSGLTSITVEATTPPTLGYDVFDNTNNCPIYVPASSVNAYKSATNWRSYSSRIQAIA